MNLSPALSQVTLEAIKLVAQPGHQPGAKPPAGKCQLLLRHEIKTRSSMQVYGRAYN